ncbi:hypothetical protein FZEAL_3752 [Fusarium zealandicum]|uniref:Rhodopsin domain-containing protein n=1 Tax=Fusarium zealandicum TaxID=1053134 RepID=A0A8H4UN30_9HYPO|nr:hypothetical protein FZEAL_3752 [Fusarium zealandicum]
MSFPGAAPPPTGVEPNLDHPRDVLKTCNYVTQGFTILSVTVFIATRFYAKSKVMGGSFTRDDYATYISYIFMLGYCITAVIAGTYGGGLNQWEVPKEHAPIFFRACYAATIFYAPMALSVKLALVSIIVRVFGSVHKKTTIGIYIFIGMLVVYYVVGLFIKIFVCWPISAYWRGEMDKCLDQSAIVTADSIISVVSDLAILLLPTPLTWSLQLSRRKRLRISGILCAGGVATAFSVYRLIMILEEGKEANQTLVFTKVLLSGNAEAGIGLICACLPAISALLVRRGRGYPSYGNPSYGNPSYGNQSQSTHGEFKRGEIMMTRSFHVDGGKTDNSGKEPHSNAFDLGHDEVGLVAGVQANPKSNWSSRRRSESTG